MERSKDFKKTTCLIESYLAQVRQQNGILKLCSESVSLVKSHGITVQLWAFFFFHFQAKWIYDHARVLHYVLNECTKQQSFGSTNNFVLCCHILHYGWRRVLSLAKQETGTPNLLYLTRCLNHFKQLLWKEFWAIKGHFFSPLSLTHSLGNFGTEFEISLVV